VKISCPSCSAKYSIADEKVQERLAKIRCRKCGTTIVIDGKVSPPTVQAADATKSEEGETDQVEEGPTADQYTVDIADNDQRNMSVAEIVAAYKDGTLAADTYVWKDGMPDWVPVAEVPEINEALAQSPAVKAAPAVGDDEPTVAMGSAGFDLGFAAAAAPNVAPKVEPEPRAAARAAAGRAGAADLFGSIDTVGSEQDVMTSALGASRSDDVTVATGARNESSVLFSLSALTSSENKNSGASSKVTEDSGLIDLASLTAGASVSGGGGFGALDLGSAPLGAPLGGSPLGGAPFGASPLGGAGVAAVAPLGLEHPTAQGSNKSGMFIGLGIAVAAIVLGGIFLLKDPAPATPTVTTVVVTASAPAEAITDPATDSPAEKTLKQKKAEQAEATQKAAEATEPQSPTSSKPKSGWRPKKPAPTPSKPAPTPAESKKPEPSSEKPKTSKPKCNCKPNDLMCAMKCSTK
jgi:predicted Zn finger-like uncharacterized protein